jgi:gliding motility-associated-like protein
LGNNYDCLFTQPNPAWFTMTIGTPGNVDFTLMNTSNVDIDFIVWGPFPNVGAALAACGNLGNGGTTGNVVDCSFSAAAVEPVQFANAQVGEVYVLLVTNFSNQPTDIYSTSNTGSAQIVCDCGMSVVYSEVPGINQGRMTDTSGFAAEFVVCGPTPGNSTGQDLYFQIDLRGDSLGDSLGLYLPGTNLDNFFASTDFAIFGPFYPVAGRYDSMQLIVRITPSTASAPFNGPIAANISILNGSCIQSLPLRILIPGVAITASDTTLCPAIAHTIPLAANIYSDSSAAGTGTYQWQQLLGPNSPLSATNIANPIASLPSSTTNGDVVQYAIQYTDATGCVVADTIDLFLQSRVLSLELTSDTNFLCNNGTPQTVQLFANLDSNRIVVSNGRLIWTPSQRLSDSTIFNPTTTLSGLRASDSVQFIVRYEYGACVGSDTLTIQFRPGYLVHSPLADTICIGETVQLSAIMTDTFVVGNPACDRYVGENIPFAPLAGTGTPVSLGDDQLSAALPIGFSFNFYCNNYTQFFISSNGYVTFTNTGFGSGCCNGQQLPDPTDPNNLIALCWEDLNPSNGGTIEYFTTGTAPNRKLVVNFLNVPLFGNTDSTQTVQLILYETSNVVEIHTTRITSDLFGFNIMTQGMENGDGSYADTIPGRNAQNFSLRNSAYRFTQARNLVQNRPTYLWSPSLGLNNDTTHNPLASPLATTTYRVSVNDAGCVHQVGIPITVQSSIAAPVLRCGGATANTISFAWDSIPGALNYEYSVDGGNTWLPTNNLSVTFGSVNPGDSIQLLLRGISGASQCPIGPNSSLVCATIPCALDLDFAPCNGLLGPTLTAQFTGSGGVASYAWSNGRTGASITGLGLGVYSVTATTGTCNIETTITITEANLPPNLAPYINTQGTVQDTIFLGEQVTLYAGVNRPGDLYAWFPFTNLSRRDSAVTVFTPTEIGSYNFLLQSIFDTCVTTANVQVVVVPAGFLGLPTAFTPNGDGQNDRFRPVQLVGATVSDFRIYNRWGALVYNNPDLSNGGWDGSYNGQAQPRDVYMYYFRYKFPQDTEFKEVRGEVTLLR